MAKVKPIIVPVELDYMFEEIGSGETLVKSAVRQLVENHREEYEELAGVVIQNEIDSLKKRVLEQKKQIERLQALNPGNVNVPVLTQTANRLQAAVEEKEDKKAKKRVRRFRG